MKIAVYSIAKDEAKHVTRWVDSTAGADGVFVLDTGSKDATVDRLQQRGVTVMERQITPFFRYDVARNIALALVPADFDVCVSLDLDEVLLPGWREAIESVWKFGKTTSLCGEVICSRTADGKPDSVYWGGRTHARLGYQWRYPCHEAVFPTLAENIAFSDGVKIEHLPDATKSRAPRLPLLLLGAQENPNDGRCAHYLGRDLLHAGKIDDAEKELKRHLAIPDAWDAERSESMRILAQISKMQKNTTQAIQWLLRACAETPWRREPWVDLAQAYYESRNFSGCHFAACQALAIAERPRNCITYGYAWGARPHDLASIGAWNIGNKQTALEQARMAAALAPTDKRLAKNVAFIENEKAT